MVLATITALTAPSTSRAEEPSFAVTNYYDRAAMDRALRSWYRGEGPLPDLIAAQDGLNQVIGPPLTADELQTVREALWRREANYIKTDFERGWPNNVLRLPRPAQQMAFTHLLNGGALRAGDFTALHGSLLTGMQPNTFALSQKWEKLMDCVGISKAPWCSFAGY